MNTRSKSTKSQQKTYCLLFRLEMDYMEECSLTKRNKLTDVLTKAGFDNSESTGLRAAFEDDDYNIFFNVVSEYAKNRKLNVEIFRMQDPGLGLFYESYYGDTTCMLYGKVDNLSHLTKPKEITHYNYVSN